MNRPEYISILAKRLKAEKYSHELNKSLTHSSYNVDNEDNCNSRYVFLGQFAFRGYVAGLLHQFVTGSGTQLQHLLGNLFKNEHLHSIYDNLQLENLIRSGEKFDNNAHRHIFVYGLLGFIHLHCPEKVKDEFVSSYFILPNKHLLNPSIKNNDLQAQCNLLCRVLYQKPIRIEMKREENELWKTTITVEAQTLASEISQSYRYSRQKALKKALIHLAEATQTVESQKPDYEKNKQIHEELRRKKIQLEKEEKQQLQAEKEEQKRTQRQATTERKKEEKEQQDLARRKAKIDAKQKKESRKGKNTIYREYSADEIAAMNPAKRRRLEDLGILAKQR